MNALQRLSLRSEQPPNADEDHDLEIVLHDGDEDGRHNVNREVKGNEDLANLLLRLNLGQSGTQAG